MRTRDEFCQQVKVTLALRVGGYCSNPICRASTSGPHSEPGKVLNLGVAAHITAAGKNGPRYNSELSAEQRKSPENGIWLCQKCAKLIDSDVDVFPDYVLYQWKREAEERASNSLRGKVSMGPLHEPVPNISGRTYHEARKILIQNNWQPLMNPWSHTNSFGVFAGNAKEFWEKGYHELVNACPTGYAFCLFKFADIYRNTLHVVTAGEEDWERGSMAMIQSHWLEIK